MELTISEIAEFRANGLKKVIFEYLQSEDKVKITIVRNDEPEVLPLVDPDWMKIRDSINMRPYFWGDNLGQAIGLVARTAMILLAAKDSLGTPRYSSIGVACDPYWLQAQWSWLGVSDKLFNVLVNTGTTPSQFGRISEAEIKMSLLQHLPETLDEAIRLHERLQD